MKGLLALLLICFGLYNSSFTQTILSIKDARALPENSIVSVRGIINTPDYGFNNGQFFIQDSTAGINIFHTSVGGEFGPSPAYNEGDTVEIKGAIKIFSKLVEIIPSEVILLGSSTTLPQPILLEGDMLFPGSPYEGMRVQINNVRLSRATQWPATSIFEGSAVNVEATVGPQEIPLIIRIDRGQSAYDGSPIPDEPFSIIGTLSRFEDDLQIFPFFEGDVFQETTTSTFETLKLANTLKIYPNPVRSNIIIEVLPEAGLAKMAAIFDIMGRKISTYPNLNAKHQTLRLAIPDEILNGNYFLVVWTENGLKSIKINVLRQ